MFAKGQGDQGSIPDWAIPKTQKMVLDATLFNTQYLSSCWSTNTSVSMCRSPLKNIPYEFVFAFPTAHSMLSLSYLDGLWDGRYVVILLGVLSGVCFEDLFKTEFRILVWFPQSFLFLTKIFFLSFHIFWQKYLFYIVSQLTYMSTI